MRSIHQGCGSDGSSPYGGSYLHEGSHSVRTTTLEDLELVAHPWQQAWPLRVISAPSPSSLTKHFAVLAVVEALQAPMAQKLTN